MDEAEKYKQRLEAIAEKRRLQEEQDKARREMEDEKLRLQQLKRKSLRDQWLMEGAPLSPTSLDALSPRSPLQGTLNQEMENQTDKSQSKNQQLSEEQEKVKEEMGYSQMDAVEVAETGTETNENEAMVKLSPPLDEAPVILTNGRRDLEVKTDHSTSEQNIQSATNGLIGSTEAVVSMNLQSGLCDSEVEPGGVPNVHISEDEEEGTLVMRAECVIITDEGDEEDVPEEFTSEGDEQESRQLGKTPLPNPEAGGQEAEAVEEAAKTETSPEAFTESKRSVVTEGTTEAQPATGDENTEDCTKENGDEETKADGQENQLEEASVQMQSPACAVEDTMVAPVPVYSEVPPSTINAKVQAESEASVAPEGAQAALKAQDPACLSDQFQEVSLTDPQDNQRTEAGPGEQEPLLLEVKASNTKAEAAGENSAASTETPSPTRASQGEETSAPKHKTCQCCSVM
ncbi:paralemmin-3 isoform X2 [Mugil cephalus]|uniref:paralemmin-3 isoform X2 n=1 Tax=Mugil cephalus TaxID=48193 RepID=UPI001FB6F808|nr:paralemmin-3 isoform X2 [Mugil cephalus]